jgi:hypothetical protein
MLIRTHALRTRTPKMLSRDQRAREILCDVLSVSMASHSDY